MIVRRLMVAAVAGPLLLLGGTAAKAADIVDTAVAADGFETLVAAVKSAGLVDALKGEGPFTVFAPTDEAFAALPEGTLEDLLKPENKDKLTAILTYHVLPAAVPSSAVNAKKVYPETLEGSHLKVTGWNSVRVDDAKVVQADIQADNGVIHVIDKVLLP